MMTLALALVLSVPPDVEAEAEVAVQMELLKLRRRAPAPAPIPVKSPYEVLFERVRTGETLTVDGAAIGKPAGKWRLFLSDGWPCCEAVREVPAAAPFASGMSPVGTNCTV